MYIPPIILTIVICVLIFYLHSKNENHQHELHQQEESLKEKARIEKLEQQEREDEAKKTSAIELLKKIYKCSDMEAISMFNILKEASLIESFLDTTRTDKEKRNTFERAKQTLKEKEELRNYFNTTLLPIIKNNSYNITFEHFEWHKDIINERLDISIEEKLKQLDSDKCINTKILRKIADEILPRLKNKDFAHFYFEKTKYTNNEYILPDDLITLANSFNKYFDFKLKNIDALSYNEFFLFDEHNLDNLLEKLFFVCILESNIVPRQLYARKFDDNFALYFFLSDLFFRIPYYNIKNYKQIIETHLDELKKYTDEQ